MLAKTKTTLKERAYCSRQLALLLNASVPLVHALDIIAKASSPSLHSVLLAVRLEITKGYSFAQTLQKRPLQFDQVFCHLVAVGELSGTLEEMLHRIADYQEKMEGLQHKVKKALFYPAVISAIGLMIGFFFMIAVVPQFESLFQQFNAELPFFTRMIVWCSQKIQRYWWIIFFAILLFPWGTQLHSQDWWFKCPFIGSLLKKTLLARFNATLSVLCNSGIPLLQGLSCAAHTTTYPSIQRKLNHLSEKIATGTTLYHAIQQTGLFPPLALQMLAVGENTGSLGPMLAKIAGMLEQEVDHMISYTTSLLEPLLMLCLGCMVGGLILAMYLPIFKIGALL